MSGVPLSAPDHDVIIVGAGPTGTLLAAELREHGLDVVVLERRSGRGEAGTRAIGIHPPVLAALEASGATERLLANAARITRGVAVSQGHVLGEVRFDRLRTRFPFVASVPQAVTEAAVGLGAPRPQFGAHVIAIHDRGDSAEVIVQSATGDAAISAPAVVIASGTSGRDLASRLSAARARHYPDRYLMTDLPTSVDRTPDTARIMLDRAGVLESFPLAHGGRRLVLWDGSRPLAEPPAHRPDSDPSEAAPTTDSVGDPVERFRERIALRMGDEVASRIETVSPFGIRRVLLTRMRHGRVFIIGDAAHEVSPIGGQGLNLGLLDAVTLAPALTSWLRDPTGVDRIEHWQRHRLAAARTASRLAGLNTVIGRPRSRVTHGAMTAILSLALRRPLVRVAARAYAMGFDRDAGIRARGRR